MTAELGGLAALGSSAAFDLGVVQIADMRISRFLLPPVAAGLLGLMSYGCSPSVQREAVDAGDWATVKKTIAEHRERGSLGLGKTRRLAEIVLERELLLAPDAHALVASIRPCAAGAAGALELRSRVADEAGASALVALFDAGTIGSSRLAKHLRDEDHAFRAAGVRTLFAPNDGVLRREAMLDPDERVRRQAFRAAMQALDVDDSEILLEAARLDPSAPVRETALRAAGAIGGEAIVNALRDLWSVADEAGRRAIVEAWGMPKSVDAGGRAQLLRVLETESGSPAILAAAILVRLGGDGATLGRVALLRAVGEGPSSSRVLATKLAPLVDAESLLTLRAATTDPDPAVALASLRRLVDSPPDRAASLDGLAALADTGSETAAIALTHAGDARGFAHLKERLTLADPRTRAKAAKALVEAGDWESAAPLLADDDVKVRTEVACQLLAKD